MSDLAIPKQTKKMLLFVSTANPFWLKATNAPATQNDIAKTIGVGHGTISTWKNGITINPGTAHEVFEATEKRIKDSRSIDSETKRRLFDVLRHFREAYGNDNVSVYEIAKLLGMTIEQCQKIIDEVIYRRGPVFPGMYYTTRSAAEEYIAPYKGVFHLWVERGKTWLRCSLRVRYVLQMGVGFTIRCKINFPVLVESVYSSRPYWEYDGFLVRRHHRMFWIFEKRQRDRNDQFYFITDIGRTHQKIDDAGTNVLTLSGTYLTTGQDKLQKTVSGNVILQQTETSNEEIMLNLMHDTPDIITQESEIKRLENLLKDFSRDATGEPSEP